tara:strand:+ start:1819 stop:1968 length:150 start_codon:yes stop_codon:yes gene_type:complete
MGVLRSKSPELHGILRSKSPGYMRSTQGSVYSEKESFDLEIFNNRKKYN